MSPLAPIGSDPLASDWLRPTTAPAATAVRPAGLTPWPPLADSAAGLNAADANILWGTQGCGAMANTLSADQFVVVMPASTNPFENLLSSGVRRARGVSRLGSCGVPGTPRPLHAAPAARGPWASAKYVPGGHLSADMAGLARLPAVSYSHVSDGYVRCEPRAAAHQFPVATSRSTTPMASTLGRLVATA